MVILHKNAGSFIHWLEENDEKLDPRDAFILNKTKSILINSSAFDWYWIWPHLKVILTGKLSDTEIKVEE